MVVATAFCKGKTHDFKLFKNSRLRFKKNQEIIVDKGYIGIEKIHSNTLIPKKSTKHHKLTKEDKKQNKNISKKRILVENVIGCLKRFRILECRYRNKRRRFSLRFNLITGIYNHELQ
jgi:hypothetical protein